MKWTANSFGGILLETECSNIAVNGGGTIAEMERAYIINGKLPAAIIVTCEHHHRSRNVDRFCLKHNVTLITTLLCGERLLLEGVRTMFMSVPESRLFVKLGVGISLIPVRYDSMDPFGLMVNDGGNLVGFVPDGKIYPAMTKYFLDCDVLLLGNRLRIPVNAVSALERRLKSVYNTQDELDSLFKNYSGELVYI